MMVVLVIGVVIGVVHHMSVVGGMFSQPCGIQIHFLDEWYFLYTFGIQKFPSLSVLTSKLQHFIQLSILEPQNKSVCLFIYLSIIYPSLCLILNFIRQKIVKRKHPRRKQKAHKAEEKNYFGKENITILDVQEVDINNSELKIF